VSISSNFLFDIKHWTGASVAQCVQCALNRNR